MSYFYIDEAIDYLKKNAKYKTQGKCAKYIADALEEGGLKFNRQPSAYMYHTKGILRELDFKIIERPSNPEKGDIYVQDRTESHPHGHIAMFCGDNWISDFIQNSDQIYSYDAGNRHYYRYINFNSKFVGKNRENIFLPFYHQHNLLYDIYPYNNYRCNICRYLISDEAYRCKYCDFDVCLNCKNNYNYIASNQLNYQNYHAHPLINMSFRNTDWRCNVCKRNFQAQKKCRARCNYCNFDVCIDCLNDIKISSRFHNHILINATLNNTNWICDVCRNHYEKNTILRYRCENCDFDVCGNCRFKY
jgi:hypothetical protein